MSKSFPVNGLKQLDAYLSALPANMQKGAYRAGLTAAAAVIRDEARIRAPKASGAMAKSIKSGSPTQNPDGTFSITIRPAGKHGFLALFHEFGTAPHLIGSTKGGVGRVALRKVNPKGGDYSDLLKGPMKIGDDFVSGVIVHPGHAAQPFMRPALDAKADEAVKAFAGRIRDYLAGVKSKTGYDAVAAVDSLDRAA